MQVRAGARQPQARQDPRNIYTIATLLLPVLYLLAELALGDGIRLGLLPIRIGRVLLHLGGLELLFKGCDAREERDAQTESEAGLVVQQCWRAGSGQWQ